MAFSELFPEIFNGSGWIPWGFHAFGAGTFVTELLNATLVSFEVSNYSNAINVGVLSDAVVLEGIIDILIINFADA